MVAAAYLNKCCGASNAVFVLAVAQYTGHLESVHASAKAGPMGQQHSYVMDKNVCAVHNVGADLLNKAEDCGPKP